MTNARLFFLVLATLGTLLIASAGAEIPVLTEKSGTITERESALWRRRPAVVIPITLIHGIPFVRLNLNGHRDELFMLDSGSENTLLDSDEALRLKLETSRRVNGNAKGLGDSTGQPIWVVSHVELKFGRHTIGKGSILATSLFKGCGLAGINVVGVLGYDILRQYLTVIDYPAQRFMIYEKGSFVPQEEPQVWMLGVAKSATLPVVSLPITVDGNKYGNARMVLDTGSDTGAMILASFAATHSLDTLVGWRAGENCGSIGGRGSFLHGLRGSIKLGEKQIELPDVALLQNKEGLVKSELYDVMLGGPSLKGLSIVFDVANGKIYLIGE